MPNLRGKTWTTSTPANVEDAQYWEDHLISDEAAQKAAGAVQSVNNTLPDENGNINITPSPLGPTVVDSLNSTSATDALSANQGHALKDLVDTKQNTLTFDNVPTNGSNNPVKSGGIYEVVEQIYADNGVLGAKNLYSLSSTRTFIKSTARTFESNKLNFKQGDTINVSFDISDVANFGGTDGISVKCIDDSEKDVSESYDYGLIEGRYKHTFTINTILTGQVRVYMFLPRAEPNNNATLKLSNIMVYLASDPDDTYVPYAMTNRELTEEKLSISELKTIASSAADFAAFKTAIANL